MKDFLNFVFYNLDLIAAIVVAFVIRFYEIKTLKKEIAQSFKNVIPFDFLTQSEKENISKILKDLENE